MMGKGDLSLQDETVKFENIYDREEADLGVSKGISRISLAIFAIIVIVVAGASVYYVLQPTNQPQQGTVVVSDPKGDIGSNPPYLDLTEARIVTLQNKSLMFQVTVADQIPKQPSGFVAYVWFLTSGTTKLVKPAIVLEYDNQTQRWSASVSNNTMEASPGQARGGGQPGARQTVARGLPFATSRSTASVTVTLDILGDPANLTWHAVSRNNPIGTRIPHIDKSPDQIDANWP